MKRQLTAAGKGKPATAPRQKWVENATGKFARGLIPNICSSIAVSFGVNERDDLIPLFLRRRDD